jgi:hypothetical protein
MRITLAKIFGRTLAGGCKLQQGTNFDIIGGVRTNFSTIQTKKRLRYMLRAETFKQTNRPYPGLIISTKGNVPSSD